MDPRLASLAQDLQRIFGSRFRSLVAYGNADADGVHTLALVDRLTYADLAACAPLAAGWRRAGLAVPLLLGGEEFVRSLDVFPIEYGRVLEEHTVVAGENPFDGLRIDERDLRRALELQAKSHLIHLREGYLESGGDSAAMSMLMAGSAPALRALLAGLERLDPGSPARVGLTPELVGDIENAGTSTIADPGPLFARYVEAVQRLWQEVDRWRP